MTDPALGSARNHQGRPWPGPGTGTPVEVRVGPRHSRPRTRIQKEPDQRDLLLRNTHNQRGDTNGLRSLDVFAGGPAGSHGRLPALVTVLRRTNSRAPELGGRAVSVALIRRLPASGGGRWSMACATFWHPTGPQDRHGRPSSLPPTPRDRHDVTRPSHPTGSSPTTKKHRRTIKQARALSRNRLVPGRAPRSRSPAEAAGARLRPRSRARRRVRLVVRPGSIPLQWGRTGYRWRHGNACVQAPSECLTGRWRARTGRAVPQEGGPPTGTARRPRAQDLRPSRLPERTSRQGRRREGDE